MNTDTIARPLQASASTTARASAARSMPTFT